MPTIDSLLKKIQEETSTMTFHIDSPHKTKKKKVKLPLVPTSEQAWNTFICEGHKKRIMVDFDETICQHVDGFNEERIDGHPFSWVKESLDILKETFFIVIFSSRFSLTNKSRDKHMKTVANWLREHDIHFDGMTADKLPAFAYIDDKGIRFEGDWRITLQQILSMLN